MSTIDLIRRARELADELSQPWGPFSLPDAVRLLRQLADELEHLNSEIEQFRSARQADDEH